MPYVESTTEFALRHGRIHVAMADGTSLFEDGAQLGRGGEMVEPPDDPEELYALRLLFCELRVEEAVKAFQELKDALLGGPPFTWQPTQFGPPPRDKDEFGQPCGKAGLLKMKDVVRIRRKALDKLMAQHSEAPEKSSSNREALAQMDAELTARKAARRREIEKIKL